MSETEGKANGNKKRRYIVMDIVFYGSSLNYDQGAGNYQELKKITKWDGKQYTLVSRYALRYSMLNNSELLLASGNEFEQEAKREGGRATIQPKKDLLFNGEIIKYPEFDLFGYLITGTDPQNARESPVKISHAISMTPFNYDTQFCGNHWMTQRILQAGKIKKDKMDIDIFTKEEHEAYYIYTVVIDCEKVGKIEVFTIKDDEANKVKEKLEDKKESNDEISGKIIINNLEVTVKMEKINQKIWKITYEIPKKEKINRIKKLIKSILNLKRNVKGEGSIYSLSLVCLGFHKGNYQTFKDRIRLSNAYEEIYEEETIPDEKNKNKIKVIKRVVKLQKPVFEIAGGISAKNWKGDGQPPVIDELSKLLEKNDNEDTESQQNEENNKEKQNKQENIDIDSFLSEKNKTGVWIYRAPEIEVRITDK